MRVFRRLDDYAYRHPWRWGVLIGVTMSVLWGLLIGTWWSGVLIGALWMLIQGLSQGHGPGRRHYERKYLTKPGR